MTSIWVRRMNLISQGKLVVRQISVKSGVSTALYDKSIKLGTLILEIMGNIFEIGGNRDMLCVSQERVVEVLRVIIQNGRRQRYFSSVSKHTALLFKTMSDRNGLFNSV